MFQNFSLPAALTTVALAPSNAAAQASQCDLMGWHRTENIAVIRCEEYSTAGEGEEGSWAKRTLIALQSPQGSVKRYITRTEPGGGDLVQHMFPAMFDKQPGQVKAAQGLRIAEDHAETLYAHLRQRGFEILSKTANQTLSGQFPCFATVGSYFQIPGPAATGHAAFRLSVREKLPADSPAGANGRFKVEMLPKAGDAIGVGFMKLGLYCADAGESDDTTDVVYGFSPTGRALFVRTRYWGSMAMLFDKWDLIAIPDPSGKTNRLRPAAGVFQNLPTLSTACSPVAVAPGAYQTGFVLRCATGPGSGSSDEVVGLYASGRSDTKARRVEFDDPLIIAQNATDLDGRVLTEISLGDRQKSWALAERALKKRGYRVITPKSASDFRFQHTKLKAGKVALGGGVFIQIERVQGGAKVPHPFTKVNVFLQRGKKRWTMSEPFEMRTQDTDSGAAEYWQIDGNTFVLRFPQGGGNDESRSSYYWLSFGKP